MASFSNDFTTQVDRHFGFLKDAGFEMLSNEASTSFDNGLAIFRNARLSIQVIRDRGDWYFEAGPLGHLRHDGHLLGEVLSIPGLAKGAEVNFRDPAAVARQLQQMLPAIEEAFTPERAAETIAAVRRLVADRWQRFMTEKVSKGSP